MGLKRSDVCPSCGKQLKYEPADEWGGGRWCCNRCKYYRVEGSARNPLKFLKKKKRRQNGNMLIKKIAMPKIGCGLDRLSWDDVKPMIQEIFKDTDIEIMICYL